MKEALALAKQAESENEVPVGAVVIRNNKIIGRGYNLRETKQSPTAHAEIIAIEEAAKTLGSWRLEGCTLYVTLEPCPMCMGACGASRVEKVVYGTSDPKGGALSLGYRLHENQKFNHRWQMTLEADEACGQILTQFFRNKRNQSEIG